MLTGYDRAYGARPLKRAIQRLVQDPLAMKILDGEVLHGDRVVVDADPLNNRLKFDVTGRQAEEPVATSAN
jgi:ATP-dependent Clp protease ATP-binding subunit ClpB